MKIIEQQLKIIGKALTIIGKPLKFIGEQMNKQRKAMKIIEILVMGKLVELHIRLQLGLIVGLVTLLRLFLTAATIIAPAACCIASA